MALQRRAFLQGLLLPLVGVAHPACADDGVQVRRLRFTLSFTNPLPRALENQAFWCYLPSSATAGQRLRETRVAVPHQVTRDAVGHEILELKFDQFAALGQKVISVTAELECDADAAAQAHPLPDAQAWLASERFIEVDDPRIRAQASVLRGATASDTARAIYEWVRQNMRYAGYLADDMGALQALLQLRGDCTEYADLVVALARAAGIPARMVGGYVTDRDAALKPQDYHNWAELYLENVWRIVDAQKENWLPPVAQYISFRIYRDAPSNAVGMAHRYRLQGQLQVRF